MIPPRNLHLIEVSAILDLHSSEERKGMFSELSNYYCFTCGASRGENGDCPCLIERRAEINNTQDQL